MEPLKRLLSLLTARERAQLRRVGVVAVGAAVLETLSVFSVLPFIAAVSDPSGFMARPEVGRVAELLGIGEARTMLLVGGAVVLALVLATNVAGAFSLRLIHLTAWNINHYLSCRLLGAYLSRPYEWFLGRNTSGLNRNLLDEVRTAIQGVLLPLLYSLVRGMGAVMLVLVLLFVDYRLTLIAGTVLGLAYLGIYYGVRALQERLGKIRIGANQIRFQVTAEALGGIKEVKSLGVEKEFLRRYGESGPPFVRAMAWTNVITELPRHILEVLSVGTVLVLLLLLILSGNSLEEALPVLALFAFAGYRLVPSFHLVFSGLNRARFYIPALKELEEDLSIEGRMPKSPGERPPSIELRESLELDEVTFRYPETSHPALDRITLSIPQGERIGVVGPTGAGKTTLADLLLGLLEPREGVVRVDGEALSGPDWSRWRASVGYVPQTIFLTDDTVAGNIAFGLPPEMVDRERVQTVARMAEVDEFVRGLSEGYDSMVGERGVRLSGGQRQRIGMARALYRDPSLLLLDEATSALDGATEEAVMDSVFGLERERTVVIIAHRLATVHRCDRIVVLEGGRVSAVGTWDELLETSDLFRVLVRLDPPARSSPGDPTSNSHEDQGPEDRSRVV